MNIESVRIKNFRSYRGDNFFDLSKRVTIFYGPNGYGKSSFFDAVEWCLTGLISRFDKKKFDPQAVLNLDAGSNTECLVAIRFDGKTLVRSFKIVDGVVKTVRAEISGPNTKRISGVKQVESFLKRQDLQTSTKDPFTALVKQSHILSQDQVTEFVLQDDPEARFRAMADIMGLKSVLTTYQNLSDIHAELKRNTTKTEKDIVDLTQKIFEERGRLIPIESIESPLINEIFALNDTSIIRGEIQTRRAELSRRNRRSRENYNRYESLQQNFGYASVWVTKNEVIKLDTKIKDLVFRISGYRGLHQKAIQLHKALSNQEKQFQRIADLQTRVKNLQQERAEFVAALEMGDKTPIQYLAESEERVVKIEYARENRSLYIALLEEERSLPTKQLEVAHRLSRSIRHVNRLNNIKSKLLTELNHYNEESAAKYVASMETILEYARTHNLHGNCPICAYPHGDNLVDRLTQGVERSIKSMSTNAARIRQLHNQVNRIDSLTHLLNEKKTTIDESAEEFRLRTKKVGRQIEGITTNLAFNSQLIIQPQEHLDNYFLEIKTVIQRLQALIQLENTRNRLEAQLKSELDQLGPYRVTANINVRLRNLNKASRRINQRIQTLQVEHKQVSDRYDSLLRFVNLAAESGFSESQNNEEVLSQLKHEMKSSEEILQQLEKGESFLNSREFNHNIDTKILQYETELNESKEKSEKSREAAASFEAYLTETATSMGTEIADMLNSQAVPVQRYFRYLNPLPGPAPLIFEDEGEKLNIMVRLAEDKEAQSARYTLSSGQLNVLAISLFLAMNESQNVSKLDFVAIDDPIQNMDDVNRFSVCDVLGRLNKQLLFATHDLDFVKLFVKKNQHQASDIQVYMLQSPFTSINEIKPVRFG